MKRLMIKAHFNGLKDVCRREWYDRKGNYNYEAILTSDEFLRAVIHRQFGIHKDRLDSKQTVEGKLSYLNFIHPLSKYKIIQGTPTITP